ncbi:restriction endonuclease [Streptomyces roseoviridis]|uniref:Restriction endonuclease n=1 Tax=Streptomyces roseoviridis TaxID=67361 RepID=A0ABV5QUK1_9ACTN
MPEGRLPQRRRQGRSGDLGADVVGHLADGRKLVIQVKKYAPHRSVGSQGMQKLVGTARLKHGADAALFVTTCRAFPRDALVLALRQDIVALHRDLLGSWGKGAHLETPIPTQRQRRHQAPLLRLSASSGLRADAAFSPAWPTHEL